MYLHRCLGICSESMGILHQLFQKHKITDNNPYVLTHH